MLLANLRHRAAFVIAVGPLAEIWLDLRDIAITGKAARLAGTLERTDQHEGKLAAGEITSDGQGFGASILSERDIGAAGVLAGETPLGLAVADDPDFTHFARDTNCSRATSCNCLIRMRSALV